jgi:hypothetical protein
MSPESETRTGRPLCPLCHVEMKVSRVITQDEHELWVYKCDDCKYETSVIVEPL